MSRGKYSTKGSEVLESVEATLYGQVRSALLEEGFPPERAEQLAAQVAKNTTEDLRYSWAGAQIYIPLDKPRRNAKIFEDFTGDNFHELASRYHLSDRQIRSIITNETDRRRMKQGSLLDAK